MTPGSIDLRTLEPGAQAALEVAREAADFLGAAQRTLDLALCDVRLPGEPGDLMAKAEDVFFPTCGIPGRPDLMHHKYAVRDGEAVWTGSTNWTQDSWTLQENVVLRAHSAAPAGACGSPRP